jgi:plasmid stabilization system protein ParE
MNGFVLHPEAYADLDEIWEYIASDNLDAAHSDCIRGIISLTGW